MRCILTPAIVLSVVGLIALPGCGGGGASAPAPSTSSSSSSSSGTGEAETTEVAPAAGESSTASEEPVGEGWGTLTGRFVYKGTAPTPAAIDVSKEPMCVQHNVVDESLTVGEDGGLANVVIYVRTKDVKVHPDAEASAAEKITLDNHNCRFEPHVLPIRLSQTLVLKNSDPFGHNSNLQPLGDTAINPILPAGGTQDYNFNREQSIPVPVSCNIHPWMKGYIVPRENPYVAISGADGSFELANLPSGTLEFQVWQEKAGYLEAKSDWSRGRFEMTIRPGDNDLGTIEVDPAVFEK